MDPYFCVSLKLPLLLTQKVPTSDYIVALFLKTQKGKTVRHTACNNTRSLQFSNNKLSFPTNYFSKIALNIYINNIVHTLVWPYSINTLVTITGVFHAKDFFYEKKKNILRIQKNEIVIPTLFPNTIFEKWNTTERQIVYVTLFSDAIITKNQMWMRIPMCTKRVLRW